jgi:ribosomal protein S18 acetylase RimI-like enzyme
MTIQIRGMICDDFEKVMALWRACEGVGLSDDDDTPEGLKRYLDQNPGLSFVALDDGDLIGAVLCGQDGRRGYIHHLAVASSHRMRGTGKALIDRCLEALQMLGVRKCHIMVFRDNQNAIAFWAKTGWFQRDDLILMSRWISELSR